MKDRWIACVQQARKSSKGLLSSKKPYPQYNKPPSFLHIYILCMYQINAYIKHFAAKVIGKWGYCPPELTTVPSIKAHRIKVTCNLSLD